jgi:dihydropteroate synthase
MAAEHPPMRLRAGRFEFHFPRPPLIMGILNVTPDSFSDGGRFLDPAAAAEQAFRLEAEGADLLDLGGESTRPHATPVPEEEELRRVRPVLERLQGGLKIPISIDTMKPGVARAAIELGAAMVNDVAANRTPGEMWELVAKTGVAYVVMHMRGAPQTMQSAPVYRDVVSEVGGFLADRLKRLRALGVEPEQMVLDVGLGFGKTAEHNLQLLAALGEFKKWGRPLLVGASRKSFIGAVSGGAEAAERLPGSLAAACWAWQAGAQILRVHDVAATRQALAVTGAILACETK